MVVIKKFLGIITLSLLLSGHVLAKEIEAFCLIKRQDLIKAELAPEDHSRFMGKEILLIINFEDNQVYDLSEEGEVSVITGMYGPLDAQKFEKVSDGIKYKHEIELKGDKEGEFVKYKYNNSITIIDDKPKRLYAVVDQSGLSFNNWKFRIQCRDFNYTEIEKQYAKRQRLTKTKQYGEGIPEYAYDLIEVIKKKGLKEKEKKKAVKEIGKGIIDTIFDPQLIENLYEVSIDGMKKLNGEEIKILLENKRIDAIYYTDEGILYSIKETHTINGDVYEKSKIQGEASGKWKVQADELCYKYDKYGTVGKYKEYEADKEFSCGVYIYSKNENYYFYSASGDYVYGKIVSRTRI